MSLGAIALALAWALVLGVLGGLLTRLDAWYYNLRMPAWKPPDWAFGPVWSVIFISAAIAFVLAWDADGMTPGRRAILVLAYGVNGCLNLAWSWLFFTRRRPDWALSETPLLWLSIGGLILAVAPSTRIGAVLLLPYLAWVTIAWKLTWDVVRLNGPSSR